MRIVIFCHSITSDWNHGNAHFLRGVSTELVSRGHRVAICEPRDAWSTRNLIADQGAGPIRQFHLAYPALSGSRYDLATIDLDRELDAADLVLVHEWNDPELIRRLGEHRARSRRYRLLFHDTHHRAASDAQAMRRFDLRNYDGVLAFGRVLRDLYLHNAWTERAWTWHEAADTRIFAPLSRSRPGADLVWIGNWGDEERNVSLREFLIEPARDLGLKAAAYGVRYPETALHELDEAGIEYRGWLANFEVPRMFAQFKVTVHVPRGFYVSALPGIPTIRVFEALACGIPLISAPWDDAEDLFDVGADFLMAHDGGDMRRKLRLVLRDDLLAGELASSGLRAIRNRHTCAHRVDELMSIYAELQFPSTKPRVSNEIDCA